AGLQPSHTCRRIRSWLPAAPRSAPLLHPSAPKEDRQRKGLLQASTEYRVAFFPALISANLLPVMRTLSLTAACVFVLTAASLGGGTVDPVAAHSQEQGWTLAWADEFSAADGSAPHARRGAVGLWRHALV